MDDELPPGLDDNPAAGYQVDAAPAEVPRISHKDRALTPPRGRWHPHEDRRPFPARPPPYDPGYPPDAYADYYHSYYYGHGYDHAGYGGYPGYDHAAYYAGGYEQQPTNGDHIDYHISEQDRGPRAEPPRYGETAQQEKAAPNIPRDKQPDGAQGSVVEAENEIVPPPPAPPAQTDTTVATADTAKEAAATKPTGDESVKATQAGAQRLSDFQKQIAEMMAKAEREAEAKKAAAAATASKAKQTAASLLRGAKLAVAAPAVAQKATTEQDSKQATASTAKVSAGVRPGLKAKGGGSKLSSLTMTNTLQLELSKAKAKATAAVLGIPRRSASPTASGPAPSHELPRSPGNAQRRYSRSRSPGGRDQRATVSRPRSRSPSMDARSHSRSPVGGRSRMRGRSISPRRGAHANGRSDQGAAYHARERSTSRSPSRSPQRGNEYQPRNAPRFSPHRMSPPRHYDDHRWPHDRHGRLDVAPRGRRGSPVGAGDRWEPDRDAVMDSWDARRGPSRSRSRSRSHSRSRSASRSSGSSYSRSPSPDAYKSSKKRKHTRHKKKSSKSKRRKHKKARKAARSSSSDSRGSYDRDGGNTYADVPFQRKESALSQPQASAQQQHAPSLEEQQRHWENEFAFLDAVDVTGILGNKPSVEAPSQVQPQQVHNSKPTLTPTEPPKPVPERAKPEPVRPSILPMKLTIPLPGEPASTTLPPSPPSLPVASQQHGTAAAATVDSTMRRSELNAEQAEAKVDDIAKQQKQKHGKDAENGKQGDGDGDASKTSKKKGIKIVAPTVAAAPIEEESFTIIPDTAVRTQHVLGQGSARTAARQKRKEFEEAPKTVEPVVASAKHDTPAPPPPPQSPARSDGEISESVSDQRDQRRPTGRAAHLGRYRSRSRSRSRSRRRSVSPDNKRDRRRSRRRTHSRSRSRSISRDRSPDAGYRRHYKDRSRGRSRTRSRSRSQAPPRYPSRSPSPVRTARLPSVLRGRMRGASKSPVPRSDATRPMDQAATDLARAAEASRLAQLAASLSSANPLLASMSGLAGSSMPNMPNMPSNAAPSLQATRHARRIYVGSLPPGCTEVMLTSFIDQAMSVSGACVSPGAPVISTYMNHDKRYAFIELRTVEEASNLLALDGVVFQGQVLRIKRPNDYNAEAAKMLGPSEPNPRINLQALRMIGTQVDEGSGSNSPNRLFIGGIPGSLTEDQVRELLAAFGALKNFHLVVDKETGANKGYGFCEYVDTATTQTAIQGLSSMVLAGRTLTVRYANQAAVATANVVAKQTGLTTQQQALVQQAQQAMAKTLGLPPPPLPPPPQPSADTDQPTATDAAQTSTTPVAGSQPAAAGQAARATSPVEENQLSVVRLEGMVTRDELLDEEDYQGLLEDTEEEVKKYGTLDKVVIPRPHPTDPSQDPPGVGLVYLCYRDTKSSERARLALSGRTFGDVAVKATIFDTAAFEAGRLE